MEGQFSFLNRFIVLHTIFVIANHGKENLGGANYLYSKNAKLNYLSESYQFPQLIKFISTSPPEYMVENPNLDAPQIFRKFNETADGVASTPAMALNGSLPYDLERTWHPFDLSFQCAVEYWVWANEIKSYRLYITLVNLPTKMTNTLGNKSLSL